MARRRLLTDEHWAGLLALPWDERDVVRHCTLASEDLARLATNRADHNRLGYALLRCAMRHPGRVLDVGKMPSASIVTYVAPDRHQSRHLEVIPGTPPDPAPSRPHHSLAPGLRPARDRERRHQAAMLSV